MATNKNQHYVPRCYLKAFTANGEGKMIATYNLDRDRLIPMAPVKNQCSQDYFYGQDADLEAALKASEDGYARVLASLSNGRCPLGDDARRALLRFWLLQHLRTEAACQRAMGMGATLFAEHPDRPATAREEHHQMVVSGLEIYVDAIREIDDLKVCLVRNKSGVPFITSDDPAAQANRWAARDHRAPIKSPGIGSSGLIVILPLTPDLLALGYDADVYRIPHSDGWIDAKRVADAEALNQHQFMNCWANIYLRDAVRFQAIREQWHSVRTWRRPEKQETTYAIADEVIPGRYNVVSEQEARRHQRSLVHMRAVRQQPAAWPRFLQWREPGAVYSNGTGIGYVRKAYCSSNAATPLRKERATG
jgi:hypothetical protein